MEMYGSALVFVTAPGIVHQLTLD